MRVELEPFDGAAAVTVLLPPIYAAIFCAARGCFEYWTRIPAGPVQFCAWIDCGGMSAEELTQWVINHSGEILVEARRASVTPRWTN